jgi:hypothetical protein
LEIIMNGNKKFHKPTGPAFNVGEVWHGVSGTQVTIVSVRKYDNGGTQISDYAVTYDQLGGVRCEKDAWNFQVRYQHDADRDL